MPSEARVEAALAEIRKGSAHYDYFFDSLTTPDWIKPLEARRVFAAPPEPEASEGWISIPGWTASRYLARMAAAAPQDVLEVALAIETGNERIHSDLTEAATAMPGPLATRWAEHEINWLRDRRLIHVLLDEHLAQLIAHLVESKEIDPAYALADELLRIYPPPDESEEIHRWTRKQASARVSPWEYNRILDKIRPSLVVADAARALALLASRLSDALKWANQDADAGEEHEDYSAIWRTRVSDDHRVADEVEQALVSALRDAAVQALAERRLSPADVVVALAPYRWNVIRRVLLHALAGTDNSDVLGPLLLDREQFVHHSPSPEYRNLLTRSFGRLATEAQQQILDWIDQGPDVDDFRALRERVDGETPTEEQVSEYVTRWRLRRLELVAADLSPEWQARRERWIEEVGRDEFRTEEPGAFFVGPTSPRSVDELAAMSDIALLELLATWKTPGNWDSPTPEGLGHSLSELAQREPLRLSRLAAELRGQAPPYVQWLLSGLAQAVRAGKEVEWTPVLKLLTWVVKQPRELPGGRSDEYGDLDPGWIWTRKEAASLLSAGFEAKAATIPIEERPRVWALIAVLVEDPDPTPEHEERYGGSNMDPSTLSLNTTRGQAMHAAIRYGLWVRRSMEATEEEALLRTDGFVRLPELREVLEAHLDPRADPSLAVRSVYGQWFPWLVLLDSTWAAAQAGAVFEQDDADRWAAAWGSYVTFNRPYDDVVALIEAAYRAAIATIGSPHPAFRWLGSSDTPEERLSEHLMILYWRGHEGLGSAGLLHAFYAEAGDTLRGHAMEFVGRSLRETTSPEEAVVARLQELWEVRVATSQTEGKAQEHAKELSAFGWWFSADALDPTWRLEQAADVLKIGIRLQPNFAVFEELARLASVHPGPTAQVLRVMLELEKNDWGIDAHRDDINTALQAIVAGDDAGARDLAVETAHWLGSQGYRDFRPVVAATAAGGSIDDPSPSDRQQ